MNHSLLSETTLEQWYSRCAAFFREYRYAFGGALLCGLLAYTYAFTNKLVNLDDLYYLFGKGATLESGRWGLVLLSLVFPDYSMPWVYGILSLLLISFGIVLCIHMFSIQNKALQFLVAGLMVTFPAMAATFSYTFTISSYAVSFVTAILPAYLLYPKEGKRIDGKRAALALMSSVFSVSIYQAYIAITASLLILILIQRILTGKETEKQLFFTGLGYVVFLALSLGLYWLSAKVVWSITGTHVGSYADAALTFDRTAILRNVKNAYACTFRIFVSGFYELIATPVAKAAHLFCGALAVVEALIWMGQKRNPARIALLIFVTAMLPLTMNCMFLFVNDIMIHSLVMYAFTSVYLLTAILLETCQNIFLGKSLWNRLRKRGYEALLWAMALIIAGNIYFANKGYLNLHLQYESTQSFASTVIAALQNTPGFEKDSKVAILGTYKKPQSMYDAFGYLEGIHGLEGIAPYTYSIAKLFEYYNGIQLNFASGEDLSGVYSSEAFANMPPFPGNGSVQQINGVFVVRLS